MNILLAIDGSSCSKQAVDTVASQFVREGITVRVLHVDDWSRDLPLTLSFGEGPSAVPDLLAWRAQRRAEADALVARTTRLLTDAGFRVDGAVQEGDARHVICETAQQWPANLIVLGSHGLTGLKRMLLGSVSDFVSRHASCSVQIVRDSA